jgi:hypothetical protein
MEFIESLGREWQKGAWWAQAEARSRKAYFSFPGAFKTCVNLWEEPGDSQTIIREWDGAWVVVRVVPAIPEPGCGQLTCTSIIEQTAQREREECSIWNTILSYIYSMSPKLSLALACLNFPMRDKILKKCFWGCWGVGVLFFSESASSWQGSADPTYKGKLFLLLLSLGAHLDTGCLNYCPAQSRSLMEI